MEQSNSDISFTNQQQNQPRERFSNRYWTGSTFLFSYSLSCQARGRLFLAI